VGELRSAVDALAAVDPEELDAGGLGALLVEVSCQEQRLAGIRLRLTAEHDRRQAWKREGFCSETGWLRDRCRLSAGEAAGRANVARRLRELPRTTQALVEGTVGEAHVKVAADAVRDLPVEATGGLDRLVADAGEVDPTSLRAAVDDYAHTVDAGSLAEREERAWRARRLSLGRGGTMEGRLDRVGVETVASALAPLAAPHGPDDTRTGEQRMADALVALARRALDDGDLPRVAAERPHVTVVVDLQRLQREDGAAAARLDRTGTLSGQAARLLACDANVSRVVIDGESRPLDVGRASRVVTPAQRKALAA
jgi:hypothetical protein